MHEQDPSQTGTPEPSKVESPRVEPAKPEKKGFWRRLFGGAPEPEPAAPTPVVPAEGQPVPVAEAPSIPAETTAQPEALPAEALALPDAAAAPVPAADAALSPTVPLAEQPFFSPEAPAAPAEPTEPERPASGVTATPEVSAAPAPDVLPFPAPTGIAPFPLPEVPVTPSDAIPPEPSASEVAAVPQVADAAVATDGAEAGPTAPEAGFVPSQAVASPIGAAPEPTAIAGIPVAPEAAAEVPAFEAQPPEAPMPPEPALPVAPPMPGAAAELEGAPAGVDGRSPAASEPEALVAEPTPAIPAEDSPAPVPEEITPAAVAEAQQADLASPPEVAPVQAEIPADLLDQDAPPVAEPAEEQPAPAGFAEAADTTPPSAELPVAAPEPAPLEKKDGFWRRLASGLARTASSISQGITDLVTKRKLDAETLEDLEDILIRADLGTVTAARIVEAVGKGRHNKEISAEEVKALIAAEVEEILKPVAQPLVIDTAKKPFVVLMVGVNGSGKTTTIGKLAAQWRAEGHKVVMAAGDTFRAAAIEQLKVWGQRTGAQVIAREPGADAAGVAFDALAMAREQGADILLIDTAGRLQNRAELMAELEKVVRVIKKQEPEAPHAVLLVLDATVGQNALSQVEAFQRTAGVTGLVMTKLDGTARGGILVAIAARHGLPVHLIGVGEAADDLQPFTARDFARAIAGVN